MARKIAERARARGVEVYKDKDGKGDVCDDTNGGPGGAVPEFSFSGLLAIIGITLVIGLGFFKRRH